MDLALLLLNGVAVAALVVMGAIRLRRELRRRGSRADLVPGVVLISAPEQVRDEVLAVVDRLSAGYEPPLQQGQRDDGSRERFFSVVVRTVSGRESRTVDDLRMRLADLRAAAEPGQEIFVSRVPRIRFESTPQRVPRTPGSGVGELPNLDRALAAANLGRTDPPAAVAPTVVVVDSGFASSVVDALPGPQPIAELPTAWPGPAPAAGRAPDHHGSAVVAVLRAAAPNVEIRLVDLPDQQRRADWFQAVFDEVAFQRSFGPIVVNLSWSYRTTLHTGEFERAVARSIYNAWLRGVVFVAASGNARRAGPGSAWEDVDRLPFPARLDTVIAVGAVDDARVRMPNSRYGPRTAPALFTMSCGQPDPDGRYYLIDVLGRAYGGTSMATALASGLIARGADLPQYPLSSPDPAGRQAWARQQAHDLLHLAVTPFGNPDPDEYGHGVLRLP